MSRWGANEAKAFVRFRHCRVKKESESPTNAHDELEGPRGELRQALPALRDYQQKHQRSVRLQTPLPVSAEQLPTGSLSCPRPRADGAR